MSSSTLPQVSSKSGYISATYHIITTDGAGPVRAIIDPSRAGQFSKGTEAEVMTQVPGEKGNIAPGPRSNNHPKSGHGSGLGGLAGKLLGKRASNVDTDHPLQVAIPAGTTCQGSMNGMPNMAGNGANSTNTNDEVAGGSGNASNSKGGNANNGNSDNSQQRGSQQRRKCKRLPPPYKDTLCALAPCSRV
ncbi:hypothetical protein MAC_08071 [Metarhizium acridum CQMa 102]|uniref:Uncharacterized protein n=1 Tax=Metarhizium acridum (strain CQMa 102) TaxID=655827 RepID=E9EDX3_METAQ|nr:uncharacterized protein MAC_08071 [Metarhizium acridum CQMa 102]EFY85865.1 hypothetical protein MAC_08071 [Metarhizium acridum CQMa 102]